MTLRLKKQSDGRSWDVYVDNEPVYYLTRTNARCDLMNLETKHSDQIYIWQTKNKDQTEYRKMRKALIAYLEPKPKVVVHPEELVWAEVVKSLGDKNEALALEVMEQATKITQLEAAHEGLANKMMDATEMMVDLRTQLRQSEERNKELCLENHSLILSLGEMKMGQLAEKKAHGLELAAHHGIIERYSNKRDMMVQQLKKASKEALEVCK